MMPKQGDKTPASCGIGWWVQYPRIFIFMPPPDDIFVQKQLPSGDETFGFNIIKMAISFRVAGMANIRDDDVIAMNQMGILSVREEPGKIVHGAEGAIDFIFTAPLGIEISLPVKYTIIKGTA